MERDREVGKRENLKPRIKPRKSIGEKIQNEK
jgi:hypothetical protein